MGPDTGAASGINGGGGPLVALCTGRRCSALRDLAGTEDRVQDLRDAVRRTRGAVLVAAQCLGPCALASLAAVARRDGRTGRPGRTLWLAGIEQPARSAALCRWIIEGGPSVPGRPDADLPAALAEAAAGLGPAAGPLGGGRDNLRAGP